MARSMILTMVHVPHFQYDICDYDGKFYTMCNESVYSDQLIIFDPDKKALVVPLENTAKKMMIPVGEEYQNSPLPHRWDVENNDTQTTICPDCAIESVKEVFLRRPSVKGQNEKLLLGSLTRLRKSVANATG